ncbi:hypothetical protein SEA_RIZWANA_6 [Arthrobacter phage Rizwana]|nr:hypothetical protein SEA_RIZWANA_6 [Arthrobacter phage Rizwana]
MMYGWLDENKKWQELPPLFPREAPPVPKADPAPLPNYAAMAAEFPLAQPHPNGMDRWVHRVAQARNQMYERFLEDVLQLTVEERATIVAYPEALPALIAGEDLNRIIIEGFGKKRTIKVLEGIMEKAETPPATEAQIKHRAEYWRMYDDPVGKALVEEILRRKAESQRKNRA